MRGERTKLLRASTVLTGRPGEVIEDGELLIDGATISAVGPRGTSRVADGVEITELAGCTLLPGMVDSHVHLGFDRTVDRSGRSAESDAHLLLRMAENARKLLSAGVTMARDLGGRDFLDLELRDAIEAGVSVGPHLVCATRPITVSGGHCWYMGGEADTPEQIRQVARENLRAGADCLKIMATGGNMTPVGPPTWRSQFSLDEIRVAVEEAQTRSRHIAAHAHGTEGIANAARAGVTTIEHCSFASENRSPTDREIDMRVIDVVAESGAFVCPTVSGNIIRHSESTPGRLEAVLDRLAKLRAAGIGFITGTDSGFGLGERENRMDDYAGCLDVYAAAGFPNSEIIEAATILPATAFGLGDLTGSLDAGKRADVIAVRGNPLREIRDIRNIELVLVSGRNVNQCGVETTASSGALA